MNEKLKLILENAIREEEYFHTFYNILADKIEDNLIKEGLKKLALQEKMHKEKIESLNFEKIGEEIIPDKINEIDVAKEVALTPIEEFNDIKEMFAFAVKQEALAQITYEKLATATKDEISKRIFEMLAEEEKKHKLLLTGELAILNN